MVTIPMNQSAVTAASKSVQFAAVRVTIAADKGGVWLGATGIQKIRSTARTTVKYRNARAAAEPVVVVTAHFGNRNIRMIDPKNLTQADVGRIVIYKNTQEGVLTSWNERFVFAKFCGPNGEACRPEDVYFLSEDET